MFNTFDAPLAPDQFFSVVVMSYTRPKHLKQLLLSLHEHADMPFEVIVHDDGSGLKHEVEIYNECRAMCSTLVFSSPNAVNMGLAAACNRAIALANSKYVLMMNDDCKMLRPALQRMKAILDLPYIGSFGPWQTTKNVAPGDVNPTGQMAPASTQGVDFNISTLPNGAGMFAFRKDVWEEVRGFPQVYTNAGDTGFMIRLLKNGYFNASTFINEEEFFTNVDQMDGYKDPTAGKSPFDSSYPHIWKFPDFLQENEHRRVRIYNYSHHNYYAAAGVVNHTWWHEQYFVKAYQPKGHTFDWDFLSLCGQDKWREMVERDLKNWRDKANV